MRPLIALCVLLIRGIPVHGQFLIPNPASAGSGQPYLSTSPDGRIYLSWIEPHGAGHRLQFAEWNGGSWKSTAIAAEGANWFINWADYPTFLPLAPGAFAAHWLERTSSSKYSYGIKLALVASPGSLWRTVFAPQVQEEGQYTGFVSLVALPRRIGVAYLAPGIGGGEEAKSLRFAQLAEDGKILSDDFLDSDVCTCCQTAAALTVRGPIVAYRGHDANEIRDISIVSYREGKWQRPHSVHRDSWRINACPVNGPALAAAGMRVAVAWFTAAGDSPRGFTSPFPRMQARILRTRFGSMVECHSGALLSR